MSVLLISLIDVCIVWFCNEWAAQRAMGVEFERDDYVFLTELGLKPENLGCYGGGVWRGNGPTATSVNPSDNKVCKINSLFSFYFFFYKFFCCELLVMSAKMCSSFLYSRKSFVKGFYGN